MTLNTAKPLEPVTIQLTRLQAEVIRQAMLHSAPELLLEASGECRLMKSLKGGLNRDFVEEFNMLTALLGDLQSDLVNDFNA